MNLTAKMIISNAVVISTCQIYILYRRDIPKWESSHQQMIHSILNIKWNYHVTNTKFMESDNIQKHRIADH